MTPEPKDTGVEGSQEKAPIETQVMVVDRRGMPDGSLAASEVLEEVFASGMPGRINLSLVLGMFKFQESHYFRVLQERDKSIAEAAKWQADYHELNRNNGVLSTKLKNAKVIKNARNILITVGGLIAGGFFSRDLLTTKKDLFGFGIGILMLVIGWVWALFEKEDE